ncbi:MAG: hypothetical protein ACFFCI_02525 [Promethearchaeota archaeon]
MLETCYKGVWRYWKKEYKKKEPPRILEKAIKLSQTRIPPLESVKTVTKETR